MRGSSAAIPLSECGVKKEKRFSFYDQVHTTGQDIKQALDAVAAITLGKDMTLRDFAQGAWRMRQLGQGQTLRVIVNGEVLNLIKELRIPPSEAEAAGADPVGLDALRTRAVAWMLANQMKSEELQNIALSQQSLRNVWRRRAFRDLLLSSAPPQQPARAALCSRFAAPASSLKDAEEILEKHSVSLGYREYSTHSCVPPVVCMGRKEAELAHSFPPLLLYL